MARVERLSDNAVRRSVARKTLLPEREGHAPAIEAFVSEAQITGQLDHPNIVPVYDFGKDSGGSLFFTMKHLSGRTLAEVVSELPLPSRDGAAEDRSALLDLLEVVLRVCDALAFAHQRGVLHGDVKPENVMVGRFGQVYLVDWGAARLSHRKPGYDDLLEPVSTSFEPARRDRVVGTVAYLSPEQAAGEELDERTDVFGVGAMLYYLLAREPPYRNLTVDEAVNRAEVADFPPLSECEQAGVVPRELARIVAQAMELQPQRRYQHIADLKRDLVSFLRGGTLPKSQFAAGQSIVQEGEAGRHAYIIVSGRCEVLKRVDGVPQRIRTLEAGDCFGETAILAASPRTASVVAIEDTVVEYISGDQLLEEVDAMKPWMGTLLRTLAERFRDRETQG